MINVIFTALLFTMLLTIIVCNIVNTVANVKQAKKFVQKLDEL